MEVDVIDNTDKSVKQQANGRCKSPLLKRGQEIHAEIGTVAFRVRSIYKARIGAAGAWPLQKATDYRNHIWQLSL